MPVRRRSRRRPLARITTSRRSMTIDARLRLRRAENGHRIGDASPARFHACGLTGMVRVSGLILTPYRRERPGRRDGLARDTAGVPRGTAPQAVLPRAAQPQWLIIQGRVPGNPFAPAARLGTQQAHPARCAAEEPGAFALRSLTDAAIRRAPSMLAKLGAVRARGADCPQLGQAYGWSYSATGRTASKQPQRPHSYA